MSRLKNLSSGEDWDYVELELELNAAEGYLLVKLCELLGLQLTSYNTLTLTLLTRTHENGNVEEGQKDSRFRVSTADLSGHPSLWDGTESTDSSSPHRSFDQDHHPEGPP